MRQQTVQPRNEDGIGLAERNASDRTPGTTGTWKCSIFGHDMSFTTDGPRMDWTCRRGCNAGGSKLYASAGDATRFAAAFDRRPNENIGRRAPLIGLFPLRMWHRLRASGMARGGASDGK